VLKLPVVLFLRAPVPRLVLRVLLCAAAPPARENDKMSAIRTQKNEVVLLKWLYIYKTSLNYYLKTV
jgi:hypothetical protein